MKLNAIAASICLLASGALIAAPAAKPQTGKMRAQLAAVDATVAKLEQVVNRNQHNVANQFQRPGWARRINVSGQVNLDAYASNRGAGFTKDSTSDITMTNASLFVDADPAAWLKTHVSLLFNSDGMSQGESDGNNIDGKFISGQKGVNVNYPYENRAFRNHIDEATFTVADFNRSPLFFRAGKMRVPFGYYANSPSVPNHVINQHNEVFPIAPSLTQLLTETHAVAGQFGFVAHNGLTGSLFAFRKEDKTSDLNKNEHDVNSWGGNIDYVNHVNGVAFDFGASYLNNMANVDFVNITNVSGTRGGPGFGFSNGYMRRVGAAAAHGDITFGKFDINGDYVTALTSFNAADIASGYNVSTSAFTGGAKPEAWSIGGGFNFNTANLPSRVSLSYQGSDDAAFVGVNDATTGTGALGVGMPKQRIQATYAVNVLGNHNKGAYADVAFQLRRDKNYSARRDLTNDHTSLTGISSEDYATVGTVRLSVGFA